VQLLLISRTLLVTSGPFGELANTAVAEAIGRGLTSGGWPQLDLCPIDDAHDAHDALDGLDPRLRQARAVIVAFARLHEDTLAGTPAFEIATRARQTGVPAYAITHDSTLGTFAARMLDLQVVVEAASPSTRALTATARRLAALV
jgi:glycerate kinase